MCILKIRFLNRLEILYWSSTVILCAMLILAGIIYLLFPEALVIYFKRYGYPTYLIHPLGFAKIIGSLIIILDKKKWLVEAVYFGFLFNFILAFFAHYMIDEFDPFPTFSLVLLFTSYFTRKKLDRSINLNK